MALLSINDLKKTFASPQGDRQLVIDLPAFSMQARDQVALAGNSGSGKTTLLNLIAGIIKPDSGQIEFASNRIDQATEAQRDRIRAENIGYVFQTFNLLQAYTAQENVELAMMFAGGLDRARASSLLETVGMADRLHYKPAQLSVGQQQRVAVARALANSPRLLLADEPTGNLDRKTAGDVLALIRDACRDHDASLLLVTHDPWVLEQFQTTYLLNDLNRACLAAVGTDAASEAAS